jgi:fructan beta-fructosidase
MSNWNYANVVPTQPWRSATTVPRNLALQQEGNRLYLSMQAVPELDVLNTKAVVLKNLAAPNGLDVGKLIKHVGLPCRIHLQLDKADDFSLTFSNDAGEELVAGYSKSGNNFYTDRTRSGNVGFHPGFAGRHTAPRLRQAEAVGITIIADVSSIELFADDGLSVLTSLFFPSRPYHKLALKTAAGCQVQKLEYTPLKSIW